MDIQNTFCNSWNRSRSSSSPEEEPRITTALMLAAGQGRRLLPHTKYLPKCLIEVSGKPLLGYAIDALEGHGFTQLIIITGHRSREIDHFLANYDTVLETLTVFNDRYADTNNLYTLRYAGALIHEPFLLLESDLIFEPEALSPMSRTDRIALDRFDANIHHGTTARVTSDGYLASLNLSNPAGPAQSLYKTVNMYSFSLSTWHKLLQALESRLDDGHVQAFYELAVSDLINAGMIELEMADLSGFWWDEVDSIQDLDRVNRQLANSSILIKDSCPHHITQDSLSESHGTGSPGTESRLAGSSDKAGRGTGYRDAGSRGIDQIQSHPEL